MADLDTAVALALQATKAVQDWCETIMDTVERQLALDGGLSTKRLRPLGEWVALSLPDWVGLAVASKGIHWAGNDPPPPKGAYFLISFHQNAASPWRVQTCWGLFDGIKRRSGQFKVFDIYRQLLDSVNRHGAGAIDARNASGTATVTSRGLADLIDRSAIQRLAEDVARDLGGASRKE